MLVSGAGCARGGGVTLAGPEAAGKWTGLQNGIGNFAGLVGPVLTGFVVEKTGSFMGAFVVTVAVLILGLISWVYVVGPLEQVNWHPRVKAAASAREFTAPDIP